MPIISSLGADARRAYGVGGVIATRVGPLTISTYSPGTRVNGWNGGPGTQYSVGFINPVSIAYNVVSKYYSANSGGTTFAYNRGVAFINPYSTISNTTLNTWGYDTGEVVRATDIAFISGSGAVDTNVTFYYARVQNGATSVASFTGLTGIYTANGPGSGFNSWSYSGSIAIPDPGINEMIFIVCLASSGFDSTSLGFSCIQYTV